MSVSVSAGVQASTPYPSRHVISPPVTPEPGPETAETRRQPSAPLDASAPHENTLKPRTDSIGS